MNIGCHIYKDFKRPSKELLEQFSNLPVANIDDNMNRTAAISYNIRRISKGHKTMVGSAFTVKVAEGDNLMFHKAMDMAKPGDIIMIDAGGASERSIFGELMAGYCKLRGIAGIVVDGSIRDVHELSEMEDFHIYAKYVTPNGPYKNGPGEIRGQICVGSVVVNPGDIIVGDDDGVVVIPQELAEDIIAKTTATKAKEKEIIDTMHKDGSYIRPWVDETLKKLGCTCDE